MGNQSLGRNPGRLWEKVITFRPIGNSDHLIVLIHRAAYFWPFKAVYLHQIFYHRWANY